MSFSTRDLYEQAKRVLRASLPPEVAGDGFFVLACSRRGLAFPDLAEMGMVEQHVSLAHPDAVPPLRLDLVWIGEGDPPRRRG